MPFNCIVSTCGTSLLTNRRPEEERRLVTRYANYRTRNEVEKQSRDDVVRLDTIIADVQQRMRGASPQDAKQLSAELNGLLTFYDGKPIPSGDRYWLICTDTWLGEEATSIVADRLQQQGGMAQVVRRCDLQTESLESFQVALAEIVRWCEDTLPGYRQRGYRVVFNLTGGTKAMAFAAIVLPSAIDLPYCT